MLPQINKNLSKSSERHTKKLPLLPPCRVCGEKASGLHYGVNTCEACKAFFRRSLQRGKLYKCHEGDDCLVQAAKRNRCSACRFNKCVNLGMCKAAIKTGRYTHEKKINDINEIKKIDKLKQHQPSTFGRIKHLDVEQNITSLEFGPNEDDNMISDSLKSGIPEAFYEGLTPEDAMEISQIDFEQNYLSIGNIHNVMTEDSIHQKHAQQPIYQQQQPNQQQSYQQQQLQHQLQLQRQQLQHQLLQQQKYEQQQQLLQQSFNQVIPPAQVHESEIMGFYSDDLISSSKPISIKNSQTLRSLSSDFTKSSPYYSPSPTSSISLSSILLSSPPSPSSHLSSLSSSPAFVPVVISPLSLSPLFSPPPSSFLSFYSKPPSVSQPSSSSLSSSSSQPSSLSSSSSQPSSLPLTPTTPSSLSSISTSSSTSSSASSLSVISTSFFKKVNPIEDHILEATINSICTNHQKNNRCNENFVKGLPKLFQQYLECQKLQTEVFGSLKPLTKDEYNMIYQCTGIDVDGRKEYLMNELPHLEAAVRRFISFAKTIPGFNNLSTDDQISLIKGTKFEVWMICGHRLFNVEHMLYTGHSGRVVSSDDMKKVNNSEMIDNIFKLQGKLHEMNLSHDETCLMASLCVMSNDTYKLENPALVDHYQNLLLECLLYLFKKKHPDDKLRFAKFTDCLLLMRSMKLECMKDEEGLVVEWGSVVEIPRLVHEIWSS